ncbi:GFA family protein [Paracoccus alkanivorans]|uniref:GFA family protein n=1 Tax=Paracoccus alkanivorans TaxID=2116655 RepID=A0A3M0M907_9RHOB|nr:GFA family protein [Paracoccus alkanivorans]RMC34246.1 GFA family protein [Paracoccus alkanivorans]
MPVDFDMTEAGAACHCGAVRLHLRFTDGLHSARRCDCSLCRMRGAVAVSVPLDGLTVLSGKDALGLYQFGTRVAEHYFCRHCGIYTHHRRRSNPNEYGVNAACIEGVSPFDFTSVEVLDGRNHPEDGGGGVAGTLTYRPAR